MSRCPRARSRVEYDGAWSIPPWPPRLWRSTQLIWILLLVTLATQSSAVEVTTLADSGPGSLRNACTAKSVILGPALAGKTIVLASRIALTGDVVIDATAAPGVIISGGGTSRMFFIPMKAKVVFAGLTFTAGSAVDPDKHKGINSSGGAIYGDMFCDLTLVRCVFRANLAKVPEGGGAAVFMSYHSKLSVLDCVFEDNDATGCGGERGGTVTLATDTTSIFRSTQFRGNKGFTGGINNLLGTMTVEDCVFEDNDGHDVGGAIYSDGASEKIDDDKGGVLTIARTRFVNNRSPGLGGACYLFMYRLDRLLVDHCLFDGNSGGHGGGFASGNGIIEIADSVFLHNTATYGGAFWTSASTVVGSAPLTVRNCLFVENDAKNGLGGGVSTETTDLVRLERCTFWKNTGRGGAVQLWKPGTSSILGCIFAENASPVWTGTAPVATGANVVWPADDAIPQSDAVVRADPLLEALAPADDRLPAAVPRSPGMAGKVGATGVTLSGGGKKGHKRVAATKVRPGGPPKLAASAKAPDPIQLESAALAKAIAAAPDAPARAAAATTLRGNLVGAGRGASGPLTDFGQITIHGGDEVSLRFTTPAGSEQALPWKLVDDTALLALARPSLGAAPPAIRVAWIALACHVGRPLPEIRTELERLKAVDADAFKRLDALVAGAKAAVPAP